MVSATRPQVRFNCAHTLLHKTIHTYYSRTLKRELLFLGRTERLEVDKMYTSLSIGGHNYLSIPLLQEAYKQCPVTLGWCTCTLCRARQPLDPTIAPFV